MRGVDPQAVEIRPCPTQAVLRGFSSIIPYFGRIYTMSTTERALEHTWQLYLNFQTYNTQEEASQVGTGDAEGGMEARYPLQRS